MYKYPLYKWMDKANAHSAVELIRKVFDEIESRAKVRFENGEEWNAALGRAQEQIRGEWFESPFSASTKTKPAEPQP